MYSVTSFFLCLSINSSELFGLDVWQIISLWFILLYAVFKVLSDKIYKILSFASCFATCALHHAVKIKLKSMLRNLCFQLHCDEHFVTFWLMLDQSSMIRMLSYHASLIQRYFLFNWRPPTLPCRLQHSTIGRLGLNHRVRDGNGCFP